MINSGFASIFSNVKKLRSDPAVQKSVPLAFGIIVTFVGIIAFYLMQKPEMTTLFSSLPENEKSAVFDALKQNGVDVSLNSATGEVIVPIEDYHNAKMLLASQGLPSSVPDGYSSLNDMPMGTSRSVEAVKIKQTLEADEFKGGKARYEPLIESHHDHLIDIKTGEIIEFVDNDIEALQKKVAEKLGYNLVDHKLELYGVKKKS